MHKTQSIDWKHYKNVLPLGVNTSEIEIDWLIDYWFIWMIRHDTSNLFMSRN